jgi:hypothetical protein
MQTALDLGGDQPMVIPFGKYKDHPIDVVRLNDPEYLTWLTTQAWFRQKFPTHTTVILNFGAKNENTPLHNRMQALFLEDEICYKLVAAVQPKLFNMECCTLEHKKSLSGYGRPNEAPPSWVAMEKERAHLVEGAAHTWAYSGDGSYRPKESTQAKAVGVSVNRTPEYKGWDWMLSASFKCSACGGRLREVHATPGQFENSRQVSVDPFTTCVELKPTLGDDYPAVMRQMQQHGMLNSYSSGSVHCVLVVERYVGEGASLEQVRKMFEAARFTLVMLEDVQNCVL